MSIFKSLEKLIEGQVYFIASEKCLELKSKVSQDLYDKCMSQIKNAIFKLVYKVIIDEYHISKDSFELIGNTKEKRFEEFANLMLKDEFIEMLYNKYPVLKNILYEKIHNIIDYMVEIIENYQKDENEIINIFNKVFGKIKSIEISSGDQHNGKSVALIHFNNDILVYKPRNLNNDILFKNVLLFFQERLHSNIKFRTQLTISHSKYSWQEYIEYSECSTLEGAQRFYYRAGVYLAIFYFFNSTDMHHENIICNGEYPIIIDLETIALGRRLEIHKKSNYKDVLSSVLNTSFIPYVNPEGLFDTNVSGLFSQTGISHEHYEDVLIEDDKLDLAYEKQPAFISEQKNQLKINGKIIESYKVADFLLQGFEDACICVMGNKENFINLIQDFISSKDVIFRQVLRPTQVYYKFIESSYYPEILKSQEKFGNLFQILSKNFKPSNYGYLRVDCEIKNLKHGNVPLFYATGSGRHLYSDSEVICENYFADTIIDCIKNKIFQFTTQDMENQKRYIRMSLASVQKKEDFGNSKVVGQVSDGSIDLAYIKKAVDSFIYNLKNSEWIISNDAGIIYTLQVSEVDNNFTIKPIGADLYQGGGIIWFLAAYGKYMKNEDIFDFAERLLKGTMATYEANKNKKHNFSVFSGEGGLFYLLYNFYKLTGKKEYLITFNKYVKEFFGLYQKPNFSKLDIDFLGGISSTLYLLCKIYIDNPSDELFQDLSNISRQYIKSISKENFDTIGMAHGISGICVTLGSIYKAFGYIEIIDILAKLMQLENKLIHNEGFDNIVCTWCRGLSGVLLSRYILKEFIGDSKLISQLEADIENFDEQFIESNFYRKDNLCLCHGLYGNIEILNYINKHNKTKKINEIIYKKYFNNLEQINWFKNFDYPVEIFMAGNCGIAYVLLEIIFDLPSVLPLDLYRGVIK